MCNACMEKRRFAWNVIMRRFIIECLIKVHIQDSFRKLIVGTAGVCLDRPALNEHKDSEFNCWIIRRNLA